LEAAAAHEPALRAAVKGWPTLPAGVVAALQHFAAGADLAGVSLAPPPRAIVAA